MERRKSEKLTNVLLRFMRESGLETPLNQYRLIEAWPEVAGSVVASNTREVYIRNQTLYVRLSRPALRANLQMLREQLVRQLNARVQAFVITDIVFL